MTENYPTLTNVILQHIQQIVMSRREGYGLPRTFYHDNALYEHELERVWLSGWVFAGHTCQIPQPGDFFTFMINTDSLIVMRDDEGRIQAFHNICTHRGTMLCEQEAGHVRAIVCPYHQWTFSRRGDLLSCYGMQDDIDKRELGLHAVHVETCEGLIFISLAEKPPAFEPARQLMAPFARPQGFERAKVARIIDYEIRANW